MLITFLEATHACRRTHGKTARTACKSLKDLQSLRFAADLEKEKNT